MCQLHRHCTVVFRLHRYFFSFNYFLLFFFTIDHSQVTFAAFLAALWHLLLLTTNRQSYRLAVEFNCRPLHLHYQQPSSVTAVACCRHTLTNLPFTTSHSYLRPDFAVNKLLSHQRKIRKDGFSISAFLQWMVFDWQTAKRPTLFILGSNGYFLLKKSKEEKRRRFLVSVFPFAWLLWASLIMTLRHSGTAHAMLLMSVALGPNHRRHFNQHQQSTNGDAAEGVQSEELSRQIDSAIRDGNYLDQSAVEATSSLFNSSPVSSATMAAFSSSSSTDLLLQLQQHMPTTPDTPTSAAFEHLFLNSTSLISSTFSPSSSTPYNYVTTLPSQIGKICLTLFYNLIIFLIS